jgi:hypothetical protein
MKTAIEFAPQAAPSAEWASLTLTRFLSGTPVFQESDNRRRSGPAAGLHAGSHPRCPRQENPAWKGIGSRIAADKVAQRVSSDGQTIGY